MIGSLVDDGRHQIADRFSVKRDRSRPDPLPSANVRRHRWGGLAELEKNDPVPDVGRCC
ncbi:hypothetical protein XAB3213_4250004 [Xanthomonas citri pv. bilvae]|nr:hypothetical protein XAB3213_4250004 [Xanthomonas citri pv. bilvae]